MFDREEDTPTMGPVAQGGLERTPDKGEVGGSSPLRPHHERRFMGVGSTTRGYSSAGRAPALHAGGQRFDPAYLHQVGRIERPRDLLSF